MNEKSLRTWYLVCQIWMLVVFGICLIPIVSLIYLTWFLFVPTIVSAIFAFVISGKLKQKTKSFDIVNIVVSGVRLIPLIGYIVGIGGIVMCILNLINRQK